MTTNKLQRVETVRVFEQAVEQIRDFILKGVWVREEKLPAEQELARQLNVSRPSVREALRVLEAEGLVEVRRGSGTFVTSGPFHNNLVTTMAKWLKQHEEILEQLLQVRESIEGLTASLAAVHAEDELLDELHANLREQDTKIVTMADDQEGLIDELVRLDAAFHLTISAASKNDIAHEIVAHIIPAFTQSNKALIYVRKVQGPMIHEHGAILEAIQARDPLAAETAMRSHIRRVWTDILRS